MARPLQLPLGKLLDPGSGFLRNIVNASSHGGSASSASDLEAITRRKPVRDYGQITAGAGIASPSACRRALTPKGTLLLSSGESDGRVLGPLDRILKALVLSPIVSQRLRSFTLKPNRQDLELVKGLIEAGKLAPVIDRTYSLSEVPEAIRYLEEGHARGKVAVAVTG